ncbi:MAG: hypothetical protein QW161_06730 [Candidatus Bathyarchaeia archaeon]
MLVVWCCIETNYYSVRKFLIVVCRIMIYGDVMAKCPKCGNEVDKPFKEWAMESKKNPKAPKLKISLYSCTCGNRFRIVQKL